MKLFQKIVRMTQPQLKKWLLKRYFGSGYKVHNESGFLYLEPDKSEALPICLTAHMDTVHKETVRQIEIEKHPEQTIITSAQGIGGDDRCGVWMICKLLDKGLRPHVVFCEDEESGCHGARKFSVTRYAREMGKECNFIVELDRRGNNDAVYYDLDNRDFEAFVTGITGYKTAEGSYTDICEIAPEADIAAVNLSCGYYKEHTLEHYVVFEEMKATLEATEKLCEASKECAKFEWKEKAWGIGKYFGNYYGGSSYIAATVTWIQDGELKADYYDGYSEMEIIGYFMLDHPNMCLNEISIQYDVY